MEITQSNMAPKEEPYQGQLKYSITLNFMDKFQYFKSPCRVKLVMMKCIELLYNSFSGLAIYDLNVELSTPKDNHRSNPRVHFHGVVEFKDLISRYTFFVDKFQCVEHVGMLNMKPLHDEDGWQKYISKEQPFIRTFLRSLSLPEHITQDTLQMGSKNLNDLYAMSKDGYDKYV